MPFRNRRSVGHSGTLVTCVLVAFLPFLARGQTVRENVQTGSAPYFKREGFVESHGVMIYFESFGRGTPLVVLHGGPGNEHSYFLPYLLPLARTHQLVFIDERGCGQSGRMQDPSGYTLDNMAQDVEAVRRSLHLGRISLLGHSFGGILAQVYAISYQRNLTHLILASTSYSADAVNADFRRIKQGLAPEIQERIATYEKAGIYQSDGTYLPEYERLVADAQRPYNYVKAMPDAGSAYHGISWDVLREMWVRTSDFELDGNMAGFDFAKGLETLKVPTLVILGDHDLISVPTAQNMQRLIAHSKLVVMQHSAHMTFVDDPGTFLAQVDAFLH